MNWLIGSFDLYSRFRRQDARAQAIEAGDISRWRQALIYGFCLIGVLLAPYVPAALAGGPYPTIEEIGRSLWTVVFAVLFSFVLIAILFKTVLDPKQPFLMHLGIALVAGFGFQKLVPLAFHVFFPGAGAR